MWYDEGEVGKDLDQALGREDWVGIPKRTGFWNRFSFPIIKSGLHWIIRLFFWSQSFEGETKKSSMNKVVI